ncbi:MAG: hypothetical protein KJ017_07050 [Alphaproteobacteria bacterium]|nr:hypothetical protein [Alphaproteobacteria bacterium]
MTKENEISWKTGALLTILQILGRLMVLAFLLAVAFSIFACPPWNCVGESGAVYILPFMAFFTILPLGLILVFATRKSKDEKKYGIKSLKKSKNFLFGLGVFCILSFLLIILTIVIRCSSLDCVYLLSRAPLSAFFFIPIPFLFFLNSYTLLPFGLLFIALSRNTKEDEDGRPD